MVSGLVESLFRTALVHSTQHLKVFSSMRACGLVSCRVSHDSLAERYIYMLILLFAKPFLIFRGCFLSRRLTCLLLWLLLPVACHAHPGGGQGGLWLRLPWSPSGGHLSASCYLWDELLLPVGRVQS